MAPKDELKAEVAAAVTAELKRVGPAAFKKAEVARHFEGRASTASLYRYIDAALKSGAPGQELAREVKAAAEKRAKAPDPAKAAAVAAAQSLPAVVQVEDVAGGAGVIPVIERLTACIAVADQVMEYARNKDGSVRSAKILLAASEHMRRNLDTAVKLQQAMAATAKVEEFHRDVLGLVEGVARDYPQAAEAIVSRLTQLAARWGGQG